MNQHFWCMYYTYTSLIHYIILIKYLLKFDLIITNWILLDTIDTLIFDFILRSLSLKGFLKIKIFIEYLKQCQANSNYLKY